MKQSRTFAMGSRLEPRLAAVLAYLLGVASGIIVLAVERESRFVRFHAVQSILFSCVAIGGLVGLMLVGHTTVTITGFIGMAAVWVYLMFQAARGHWYQLSWVGWWSERNV